MQRPGLEELTQTQFDMVIVGGGITGVAVARDAALRGLSVALVEKDDFAAGTSSRSSKLIHGGLRYLQTYQFRLVAESLRERERALTLAPHLTDVRPFLYLLYKGYPESRFMLNLGLTFYDVASGQWRKRRHSMLSADDVMAVEPHLARKGLLGAGRYFDVLTDDARLTLDTAKGAAQAGATLLNHAKVVGLVLENGAARGVKVEDQLTGALFDIHAKTVLNASGPWTDRTRALEHGAESGGRLRPTKGVHIVVRKSDFPLNTAVFLRSPDDGRVVWPTPSLEDDVVYIGTTDTDYDGDLDHVVPDERDVTYLLNVANATIPDAHLTERHIVGSWAGLRPLIAPEPGTSESNTSREHAITTGPTGMITISGGKLTSSRIMGKQLVDAAISAASLTAGPGRAAKIPLSGGAAVRTDFAARASSVDVPDAVHRSWSRRYGSNAESILNIWASEEDSRAEIGPRGLTVAEIRYAVREEQCASIEDLLVRRTSIFFWDRSGGLSHVDAIAAELADALHWDAQRVGAEIANYRDLVAHHRPGRNPPA